MKCKYCKQEMEGFWCDDIHDVGMFYECICGKKYFESDGKTIIENVK